MKITVLSSLLREPFMIDLGHALDSGPLIGQLLDPDVRKFAPREEYVQHFIRPSADDNGDDFMQDPDGNTPPDEEETGIIAVVPLHGTMLKYGTLCSYGTTEIARYLRAVMSDERVTGILLDVDTPGGAVNSIPPVIEVLSARTKPVLAYCDTCCSAGLFASLYCDEIWAGNDISSVFGSVGVQISFADMRPYWEKQGVVFHTVRPPESEDKNKAFELALQGKYDLIIEEMLSPMARRFQQEVRDHRPKLKEEPGVLSGKTYNAGRALDLGLIDLIGTRKEAVARINELALQYDVRSLIANS